MAKRKTAKFAVLASAISLMLSCVMLFGSTFAWFTDSVENANNVIQTGNLDVVLEYKTDWNDEWKTFTETTELFDEAARYEPGYTEVVFLRVANAGTLALEYDLNVKINSESSSTNVAGETFALKDYLKIGTYVQDEYSSGANYADILFPVMFGTREAALNSVASTIKPLSTNTAVCEDRPVLAGEKTSQVVALVLTMPTTVGNEANHKTGVAAPTIDLGIELTATQYTDEEDSFDNQYDVAAYFAKKPVAIVENLDVAKQDMYIVTDLSQGFGKGTNISVEPDVAFTFKATDTAATVAESPYKDWLVDYYVSVDGVIEDGLYLVGCYDNWENGSWYGFQAPAEDYGQMDPIGLLGVMSSGGVSNWTYEKIVTGVNTFSCGVYNGNDNNNGRVMTVELRIMNPKAPETDYFALNTVKYILE